jgi:hypothetical protein
MQWPPPLQPRPHLAHNPRYDASVTSFALAVETASDVCQRASTTARLRDAIQWGYNGGEIT